MQFEVFIGFWNIKSPVVGPIPEGEVLAGGTNDTWLVWGTVDVDLSELGR